MDGHEGIVRLDVDGHLAYRMLRLRGHAQHARITQPDGTVWSGFCGWVIGYGFDDDMTEPHAAHHAAAFED